MSSFREKLENLVIPWLGFAYIRCVRWTGRAEYRNREVLDRVRRENGQYIIVFWHSRFVMMPYCYPDKRIAILSSEHRDSQLLAAILRRFGFELAPGSSTRGGAKGLRTLLRRVKDGYDLAVTPDGPRGPRRRLKAGAIAAAKLSGLPLIPVAYSARPAGRLGSWDRTLLPYPFSRGLYIYGEPISVPRDAADETVEAIRLDLERRLDRLTDEADEAMGLEVEEPRPAETP